MNNNMDTKQTDIPDVPNIYSKYVLNNEKMVLLNNTKIVVANYDLLRQDFDFLSSLSDSKIDD